MGHDPFMRDGLVAAALDTLTDADSWRHLAEAYALILELRRRPDRSADLTFELQLRALMARCNDDPTVVAWAAWIRSRDLAAEAEAIYAGPPADTGAGVE